jgi:eukaryotic-like serine/threonine-protein kinase
LRADHPDTLDYLALLGEVVCLAGRPAEAEPLLRQCVALRPPVSPPDYWDTAGARSLLGHCLAKQGKYAEAEPLLLAGYEDLLATKGVPARQLGRAGDRIVLLYERWGRPEQAEAWRKKRSGP